MSLIAKTNGNDGGDYEPAPQGMHHAICYRVYDLGVQYNDKFQKSQPKVLIVWELPGVRIDIEKDGVNQNLPRSISKEYTLSLHEKAILRHHLESWRGKAFTPEEEWGFDISKLLGVNCMLQIIHNVTPTKTYANITNVLPLMKPEDKKNPENELKIFTFDNGFDIPENTPNWIKGKIMESEEWQRKFSNNGYSDVPVGTPPPDDGIPF